MQQSAAEGAKHTPAQMFCKSVLGLQNGSGQRRKCFKYQNAEQYKPDYAGFTEKSEHDIVRAGIIRRLKYGIISQIAKTNTVERMRLKNLPGFFPKIDARIDGGATLQRRSALEQYGSQWVKEREQSDHQDQGKNGKKSSETQVPDQNHERGDEASN